MALRRLLAACCGLAAGAAAAAPAPAPPSVPADAAYLPADSPAVLWTGRSKLIPGAADPGGDGLVSATTLLVMRNRASDKKLSSLSLSLSLLRDAAPPLLDVRRRDVNAIVGDVSALAAEAVAAGE